jgi:hypothetical protein
MPYDSRYCSSDFILGYRDGIAPSHRLRPFAPLLSALTLDTIPCMGDLARWNTFCLLLDLDGRLRCYCFGHIGVACLQHAIS